ncbi:MAG: carbohydrate-binding domain-containing protein [Ruminococcus sp.]|nr:carbohydrate-binding domain-containing protein [Ruminococcus sp.]
MKKFNRHIIAGFSTALITALSLTAISASSADTLYGDANCDGDVNIADATAIIQALGNKDKYNLSEQGADNADVFNRGDGVTGMDALSIQKLEAKMLDTLPESWQEGTNPEGAETYIHLNGDTATVDGENAEVNGGVITITHSGSFYVDGTLSDGQINVNIADEVADAETVKIFLNGVNITGKSASAIYVTNAENTSINIVDGTENFISDGDTAYTGDYLNCAVIEAKDDITIKGGELGTGILNITANNQDGIVCNNDIKINGGTINIDTLSADKTDAVKGKTSVTVKSGTVNIDATGDGIKSSKGSVAVQGGVLSIKAGNDALQAETTIDISDGAVVAGGDRGLTAVGGVNITGGYVVATATDNQVDTSLLTVSQNTLLFNCIDDSTSKDGTWKKANSIGWDVINPESNTDYIGTEFLKKYKYILISDEVLTDGSYTFRNNSTKEKIIHDDSDKFEVKSGVNVFDNVNPAGNGGSAPVETPTETSSITLESSKTVEITTPGSYSISGKAEEAQIVVNVDKTTYPDGVVELNLEGADISNSKTAPIYVQSIGDEVQIIAKAGTVNTISDGTEHTQTYTDADGNTNTVEGAIFARDDIKFKGSGTLTVNGNTDDAIVCKNDIKIYNGNLIVNAVDDGIRGKDSVTIGNDTATDYANLKLTIKTQQGDGIKSTATDTDTTKQYGIITINGGTVDITSYADGIQAEQDVVINGGDINIYTYEGSGYTGSGSTTGTTTNPWGGGRPGGMGGMQDGNSNKTDISAKGIKAVGLYDTAGTTWQSGGNITINGGNIIIDSSDDAIHCGGSMTVYGGQFKIASADDALHSDHDLTLGTKGDSYSDFGIYVSKCYEGVEGQNIYQYSGTVVVKADDDGYNAAGDADGSGSGNNMGWGQGGFGGGFGGGGNNVLEISGGIAIVQSASGDHDAFDSNGSLTVSGGVVIANGQEPLDSDGTNTANGGTVLAVSSQSAGTVASGTQFTVADDSGKVIVSFTTMQGMGSITTKHSDDTISMYTGGTITGGTDLIALDDAQKVYADGTISGGTTVSAGGNSDTQNPWGGRF